MIKQGDTLQPATYQNRFGGQGEVTMKHLLAADEFAARGGFSPTM